MNKQKTYLRYVFWPAQIIALLAIIFTSPNWLFLFLGWVLFCGLGSAVVLHRVVCHKSIQVKSYLKKRKTFLRKEVNSFETIENDRPMVFITHMEHHSNHTSWLETIADVEIIAADEEGLVNINHLEQLLVQYTHRKNKIVSVTSCSNVTGLLTPYHEIAKIGHAHGARARRPRVPQPCRRRAECRTAPRPSLRGHGSGS